MELVLGCDIGFYRSRSVVGTAEYYLCGQHRLCCCHNLNLSGRRSLRLDKLLTFRPAIMSCSHKFSGPRPMRDLSLPESLELFLIFSSYQ